MRPIRKEEAELIATLLRGKPNYNSLIDQLEKVYVDDMEDGGMGSIRFGEPGQRKLGKQIAEITLLDLDEVPVSFALNIDQNGDLYELDVFKSDFSPLKQIPTPPYNIIRSD